MNSNPVDIFKVEDDYSQTYFITDELSRGGQGVVYRTRDDEILIKIALKDGKLVSDPSGNAEYKRLKRLPVDSGTHITLPLAVLKNYEGYVMRMLGGMETFREHFEVIRQGDELKSTAWIGKTDRWKDTFANFYSTGGSKRRLEAFLKSGSLLWQLHCRGLVYCDFSGNNAFISKNHQFCNVWLIDADNLSYEKDSLQSYLFTPGLAAPEICQFVLECNNNVPEEQRCGCGNSFSSDVYTFAICLFKELTFVDPFEGKLFQEELDVCENRQDIDSKKENGQYAYIDDICDDSNRNAFFDDTFGYTLTSELKGLFQRTFSSDLGKLARWLRPTMAEYCLGLARALDTVCHCEKCGMDYFMGSEHVDSCPWCGEKRNNTLIMWSYYFENNAKGAAIWQFRRTITDGKIYIPLRILYGYMVTELDEYILEFQAENKQFLIRINDKGTEINMSFSLDGKNFKRGTSFVFKGGKFILRMQDMKTSECWTVEGSVE